MGEIRDTAVRPARELTLMVVHAHPDDEALTTGGILARYAAEGIRTVLVTCTDGRCGDGPKGVKPGEPGHDPTAVVEMRRAELAESCAILQVSDLERLEYPDSGMMGWPSNEVPGSFWATPKPKAADQLADLMRRYRPDVVVTYDPNGFYGHPDHIQAHRVTMAALELVEPNTRPAKVYWTTIPHSSLAAFAARMRENGADWDLGGDLEPAVGLPDAEVTAWVDVREVVGSKFRALGAHASQSDNAFFLRFGLAGFAELFGTETFHRVEPRTELSSEREVDLFAGLR